jgi:hypothetical protein
MSRRPGRSPLLARVGPPFQLTIPEALDFREHSILSAISVDPGQTSTARTSQGQDEDLRGVSRLCGCWIGKVALCLHRESADCSSGSAALPPRRLRTYIRNGHDGVPPASPPSACAVQVSQPIEQFIVLQPQLGLSESIVELPKFRSLKPDPRATKIPRLGSCWASGGRAVNIQDGMALSMWNHQPCE